MRVSKRQLRRIIRETVSLIEYGRHDPDSGYDELRQDRDDQEWEDGEYQRGYQDALDGLPVADNASGAYDAGYETATSELEANDLDYRESIR
jgi:hypothetical protein|tara:strand:+ start:95 stop:370 length:276 start_codon:yes stop_codon:yes gene_type:complete